MSFDPVKLCHGVEGTVVEEKNVGIVVEEGCIGVAEVGSVDVEPKMNEVYVMEEQLDSTSMAVFVIL